MTTEKAGSDLIHDILDGVKKKVPELTDEMAAQVEKNIHQEWGGDRDHVSPCCRY